MRKSSFITCRFVSTLEGHCEPLRCDVCARTFFDGSAFTKHKKLHEGEKTFECNVSGRAFSRTTSYSRRKLTCIGEKPLKCDPCVKIFADVSNSRVQLRVHTGEKPYKGNVCSRELSRPSACEQAASDGTHWLEVTVLVPDGGRAVRYGGGQLLNTCGWGEAVYFFIKIKFLHNAYPPSVT